MKRGAIACMRSLLLLLLLVGGEANGWILGGKKGGKDAPGGKKKVVQASLPPSAFVRIFALPSEEAKMAQVRSSYIRPVRLLGTCLAFWVVPTTLM